MTKNNSYQKKLIVEVGNILEANRCNWWLQSGALLGLEREGDLLAHDHDVDFGVMADSFNAKCMLRLLSEGYMLYKVYGGKNCMEITLLKDLYMVDLFFWYTNGAGEMYHSAFYDPDRESHERYDYIHPLFTTKFKDYGFGALRVPRNPKKYLTELYGDWKTPVKEFAFWRDPVNVYPTKMVYNFTDAWLYFWQWMNGTLTE